MELRSLYYFTAVAEELNITRAAKKLHMSQPPLSAQIKNLEKELDTELFIRGGRQLMLTESGQLLYRRAKEILKMSDKTRSEVLSMGKGMRGTISIGVVEGMGSYIAADWILGFQEKFPNIKFRVLSGGTDDLLENMRGGLISLAVIMGPCDNSMLHSFPVGRQRLAAIMEKSHRLAGGEGQIEISELAGEKIILPGRTTLTESIYKWFKAVGEEPNVVCESSSFLNALALADRKIGIGIGPRASYIKTDSLAFRDLAGDDKDLEYLFVWRKGHPLPTIEERFIDHVRSAAGMK